MGKRRNFKDKDDLRKLINEIKLYMSFVYAQEKELADFRKKSEEIIDSLKRLIELMENDTNKRCVQKKR